MPAPNVEAFFDAQTWTISYVVYDAPKGEAVIIDPVLDFDQKSGRTSTKQADQIIAFVHEKQLTIKWLLETHAHADHISAAAYLRKHIGGRICIGAKITEVQRAFAKVFNLGSEFAPDGKQFDCTLHESDTLNAGDLSIRVMEVPGHTPADVAYQIGDAVFVGDTLFMPDVGTARCDFPGGNARQLYASIRRLLSLPLDTRLFMCHDYPPPGRGAQWESSVAEQRRANMHVHDGVDEEAFVTMREARDRTLSMPQLILPSIQINIRAGEFPPAEANGISYLKLPLNAL
ncbi:MBL fold metallo-hydrolase [Burkholderiaceae bacterium DAT-1]|nr:MBL fold metallo-hydrolase [Burkholderiaceae bacterium DAT-1]